MSNKLEATIGDKIILYKNGLPFKTVKSYRESCI